MDSRIEICIFCIFIIFVIILYFYKREQKLLKSLQEMLNHAIDGNFEDKRLDESRYSVIENSMWRYLCDNALSYQKIKEEKEKMQVFISDICHQAVTPVSNIMLYSELLKDWQMEIIEQKKMQELEMPKEEIEAIYEQAKKLDFFIQSLMKLSRLETGIITINPSYGDIRTVLSSVKQQFILKAKQKGIRFEIEEIENLSGFAVFDQKWTMEAISNIIDNAIKYTKSGGKVFIHIEEYIIFLRIDIIDTGIGIEETEQGSIFTRFYRSSKVSEQTGLGLGLYLAREVIKAQNGYIKVKSEVGKGSTFSVFLLRKKD